MLFYVTFAMKRGSSEGGSAEGSADKEGEDRAAKCRAEHWECPQCKAEKTGSGFEWVRALNSYLCAACYDQWKNASAGKKD